MADPSRLITNTSALVKALSNNEPREDENMTLSDKPQPDAKNPKKTPGIVRIAPIILHTISALSSFAQLSMRTAMIPAVVMSVPIFKMYIRKKRRTCICYLSCDLEAFALPTFIRYKQHRAYAEKYIAHPYRA